VELNTVMCGDCLEKMKDIPSETFDLIIADPPYFKTVEESWDRQWRTASDYLGWLESAAVEFGRVLKPTGSLYCFAAPKMAAKVEVMLEKHFEILNQIVWEKPEGTGAFKYGAENLRRFVQKSERIVFCEQKKAFDSDSFPHEKLYLYMEGERAKSGASKRDVNVALGFRESGGMAGRKYFSRTEFCLPTPERYEALQKAYPGCYRRPFADLKEEYEAARKRVALGPKRHFALTPEIQHSDVWNFAGVGHRARSHPCEKPEGLLRHIISVSTEPGDVVLDPFAGSGAALAAARSLGRGFLGIEADPEICASARDRASAVQLALF